MSYIPTASGAEYHFGRPNPGVVRIRDIASHLACINRWTGATMTPLSVAQHSVLVADVCAEADWTAGLYGLLHDAPEYVLGDHSRPLRAWVARAHGSDLLGDLETRIAGDICEQLAIPWPMPEAYRRIVADADDRVLATEHRDLMPDRCTIFAAHSLSRVIKPWPWHIAEERFLAKYADLCAMTGTPNQLETS